MSNTVRSKAEDRFAASQKKDAQALKDREEKRRKDAAHVAKLRALRLAKEVADREAAEAVDARKKAARKKTPSR